MHILICGIVYYLLEQENDQFNLLDYFRWLAASSYLPAVVAHRLRAPGCLLGIKMSVFLL
jgi:hypothetical protein